MAKTKQPGSWRAQTRRIRIDPNRLSNRRAADRREELRRATAPSTVGAYDKPIAPLTLGKEEHLAGLWSVLGLGD